MHITANIRIHPSQFPDKVRHDLLTSLRTRQVNHKFHYDSIKQTQKWLALHEAHSPARYDKDCLATYGRAFAAVASLVTAKSVHVIGLGCGGGQKDVQLLEQLQGNNKKLFYTASDVSVAMVLVARQAALDRVSAGQCFPLVCDLAAAGELQPDLAASAPRHTKRVVTFFGMLPNFEPRQILPKLAALVRPNDHLLLSANLAPGQDYAGGVAKILPQYDNPLTRDWLMAFLYDLGVEAGDGELRFAVETAGQGLQRIVARFHFQRTRQIRVDEQVFCFERNESIRLFFSYRYTPARVRQWLGRHGLNVTDEWITTSGEEGVFLCQQSS
ncbi:MAG: L-histidine N(alpha)-methyltransferase [Verrucomicrobiota bacterium]